MVGFPASHVSFRGGVKPIGSMYATKCRYIYILYIIYYIYTHILYIYIPYMDLMGICSSSSTPLKSPPQTRPAILSHLQRFGGGDGCWLTDQWFGWFVYSPENEQMSPENQWLEDVFPIEIVIIGEHVSFRECMFYQKGCPICHFWADDFPNFPFGGIS